MLRGELSVKALKGREASQELREDGYWIID